MSEDTKLGTLDSMVKEIFIKEPNSPSEAITEYLKNIEEDTNTQKTKLKEDLANPAYYEQFKKDISMTSIMLFIIARKAQLMSLPKDIDVPDLDLDKYILEFLESSYKDDKHTFEMKEYHFNQLDGENMIGDVERERFEDDEQFNAAITSLNKIKKNYNTLLNSFKNQYFETNISFTRTK